MNIKLSGQVTLRKETYFKKVGKEWILADALYTGRASHVFHYPEKTYPSLTMACDQFDLDRQYSQTQKINQPCFEQSTT